VIRSISSSRSGRSQSLINHQCFTRMQPDLTHLSGEEPNYDKN